MRDDYAAEAGRYDRRKVLLGAAGAVAGGGVAAALIGADGALASGKSRHHGHHGHGKMRKIAAPNPIAGGFVFPYRGVEEFTGHIFSPGPVGQVLPHTQVPLEGNVEPSTVGDFNGSIAMGFLIGEVDSSDGPQNLEVDLRVMQGDYIGEDGNQNYGTFALF